VKVQASPGGLLLFGAAHTRDAADPELAMLDREWGAFRPTVALVEGRLGFLFPHLMDPVAEYGEMGATAARARAGDVPLYTWELRPEWEDRRMLDSFPAPRVALFYPAGGARRRLGAMIDGRVAVLTWNSRPSPGCMP